MKNMLSMLKRHWMIIVLTVVALAALPTAWFFSNGWYGSLIGNLEKKVTDDYNKVTKAKNEYALTSPTGDKVLVKTASVNARMTREYAAIGERMQQQTGTVATAAIDFNKAGKSLLVQGLFPQPPELERQSKPNEFARAYVAAHPRLLESIHAGMPPAPDALAQQLNEIVARRKDEVRVNSGRTELDQAEREAQAKELLDTRLGQYQAAASKAQVYADINSFAGIKEAETDKTPTLARTWDWQERFWIHQDIINAIKTVNGDSGGRGVPGSVIKRIVAIAPDPAPWFNSNSGGQDERVDSKPFEAGVDRVASDFAYSVTGRRGGPGSNNKWYDVRHVGVIVIADAQRLPAFIDALAATNFMSVIDADMQKVDPHDDLREGFYYGESGVVRATLMIETVFFREWREKDMPQDVKRALGMDQSAPAAEAASAPTPPPRPTRPPPGGEGGEESPRRGRRAPGGGD